MRTTEELLTSIRAREQHIQRLKENDTERNRLYDNGHTFMQISGTMATGTILAVGVCIDQGAALALVIALGFASQLSTMFVGFNYYRRARAIKN